MFLYICYGLAFLSGIMMAIVMIVDRLLLRKVLDHPLQQVVISSSLMSFGFLTAPFVDWHFPASSLVTTAAFGAGVLYVISNCFYFSAMKQAGEAAEVAAWDASSSLTMLPLGALFGIRAMFRQWFGIPLVALGLVVLQWQKQGQGVDWRYRTMLIMHSLTLAMHGVLFGWALYAGGNRFWDIWFPYLGGHVTGVSALAVPSVWQSFRSNGQKVRTFWWAFLISEGCYFASLLCGNYSIKELNPAVVSAIAGTYPVFVLFAGPLLRRSQRLRMWGADKEFTEWQGITTVRKTVALALNTVGLGLLAPSR